MSALLFRLGRNSARHPFRVIGLWLVAAIADRGAARRCRRTLRRQLPGPRRRVTASRRHPEGPVPEPRRPDGTHRRPRRRRPARRRRPQTDHRPKPVSNCRRGHDVAGVTDPFAAQSAALSQDGQTAYVDVAYTLDKLTVTQLHDAQTAAGSAQRRRRADRVHRCTRSAREEGSQQRAHRHRRRHHRAADRLRLRGRHGPARSSPRSWACSSAPPASACCPPSWTFPSSR